MTFVRSADVTVDMRPLLKDACRMVGGGGGGQPNMAQGGGAQVDQAASALETAVQSLRGLLAK
jgi:alanyl-tRNA synthetase